MDFNKAVDLSPKRNLRPVKETNIGVYVWEMPDGSWVGDDEGNFMYIQSDEGNPKRLEALAKAARSYGLNEGRPVFLAGHRPVSEEEYQEQRARLHEGLVPDKFDPGIFREEANARK